MKRRLMLILVLISMIFSSTFIAFADSTQTVSSYIPAAVTVDGQQLDSADYTTFINDDGSIMYPLRLISEGLGTEITWEATKESALLTNYNGEIWVNPFEKVATVNGVEKKLNESIALKNSRIYVDTKFISQILGARLEIDKDTLAISLIKPSAGLESLELTTEEENIQRAIASYLTSLELHRNFSGQVLVAKDDKILLDRSYGYSDYENQIKAFNSTTFAIGSVTKQFTAAAVIQLAEDNKLSYEDKVSKHLSNVPFADQITIHQLLTHTSGLYNYTNQLSDFLDIDEAEWHFERIMELIQDKPLDFEPGTNWNYSNTGYLILGEIVEKLSGQTLDKYLQDNIFTPAGMKNTGVAYRMDEKIVEANGYSGSMEVMLDTVDRILLNVAYGAGYLHSTAEDLYRWNTALLAGEIISAESLERMFGKASDMALLVPYGYALMFDTGVYGEEIFHGGNTIGFTSENAIFTDENAQIIILTNKGYADLNSIKYNIASMIKGNIVPPVEELTYITVSEEQLNKYIGTYEIKDMLVIDIFVENGKLMLQGEGQPAIALDPVSEIFYESTSFGIAIEYDSKDTPSGFMLYQAGMQFRAEKIK